MQLTLSDAVLSCTVRSIREKCSWKSGSYTVLLVTRGGAAVSSGEEVTARRFLACLPALPLTLEPEGSCECIFLTFHPSAISGLPGGEALLSGAISEKDLSEENLEEITDILKKCAGGEPDPSGSELDLASRLFRLLHILRKSRPFSDVVPKPVIPLSGRKYEFYRSLFLYIQSRTEDIPGQGETAAMYGISPQYLGRFLKETTGKTFREIISSLSERRTEQRLRFEQGLKESDPLPGAELSGAFSGAAPVLLKNPGARSVKETSMRAVLEPKMRLRRHWTKLINLGYAVNLKNIELGETLSVMSKDGGFEYGRICRITDLITPFRIGGRVLHDYSQVFPLLDSLMAAGITPFLELGNKSFTIQETTSINFTPLSPVDTRKYYSDLLLILPDFLRACVNHYGQENFDRWYFEISYMYTDSGAKETFGLIQYAKAFRKIYSVIRGFSEKCRIGGPGFNDWSSPGKVLQAVRLLSAHGIIPDFFSAYCYPVNISGDSISLSSDPETGIRRIELFAGTVREFYPDAEIWITEFNSNLSSRSFLNDSCYQAAFLAKMFLKTEESRITALGYYLLSDAPLRYLDSLDFMFGGWGLFTDMSIPKASWNTYRMMSMLGHYCILRTDNALVTANSRGSVRILLYRYCHPNETFCRKNVEYTDLLTPGRIFNGSGSERITITIDNILSGTYILKEYRLGTEEGNLYAAWRDLGFLYPKDRDTAAELRMRSSLIPRTRVYLQKKNRPCTVSAALTGNEVVLISLELYTSHISDTAEKT